MNKTMTGLALALLLSACGGGLFKEEEEDEDPSPSGRTVSLVVSGATVADLDGTYSSSDADLGAVQRSTESDAAAQVCTFRFEDLRHANSTRRMAGTITYAPIVTGTRTAHEMRSTSVTIGETGFTLQGGAGVATNLGSDQVLFAGAVLTGTTGTPRPTITLTGTLPVVGSRPSGC